MTTFLVAMAVCLAVGIVDLISKKTKAQTYKTSNRGSRAVELEEWNKWSALLLEEYNELTGLNIPYPEIKLTSDNFCGAYYYAFGGPYAPSLENKWKDAAAIEALRVRHNLPSDDELYINEEWMYSRKIVCRPTHYTSLGYVILKCVHRSVHERGYMYGGRDWDGEEAARLKWKEIESKNAWLNNDPADNGKS